MTGGIGVDQAKQVRGQLIRRHAMEVAHEGRKIATRVTRVVARHVHLGAVTGRQHDGFVGARPLGQLSQGLRDPTPGEVDALAQVHRSGVVTDAKNEEMH